jgi:hypothetical protein
MQVDPDRKHWRMLVQLALQHIGGQITIALAALGATPTPRLPASIAAAGTSFMVFFRIGDSFQVGWGFPGLAADRQPPSATLPGLAPDLFGV